MSDSNIEFVARMDEMISGKTILHVAYSPSEDGFALIFDDHTTMIVAKPYAVFYGDAKKLMDQVKDPNLN